LNPAVKKAMRINPVGITVGDGILGVIGEVADKFSNDGGF
jgi:hypothetical protein